MSSERKFVQENVRRVLLKEYLQKETERAGFGGCEIQRTPLGARITLIVERPGMVIGRRGGAIKHITEVVENKYKFDNPQIEVKECEEPGLNAQIMASKLAFALERGWHFRRAGHSTVRRIMDSGARGCLVAISGKLTGERHRTEKFREGHIKYCGEPAIQLIDKGYAVAKKKQGIMGVKVWIMKKDAKLPDEITIKLPVPQESAPAQSSSGQSVPVAKSTPDTVAAAIAGADKAIKEAENVIEKVDEEISKEQQVLNSVKKE
ncbi:MAG: 30S ribosomal protein S3 [Thermoplasmata archaeon]